MAAYDDMRYLGESDPRNKGITTAMTTQGTTQPTIPNNPNAQRPGPDPTAYQPQSFSDNLAERGASNLSEAGSFLGKGQIPAALISGLAGVGQRAVGGAIDAYNRTPFGNANNMALDAINNDDGSIRKALGLPELQAPQPAQAGMAQAGIPQLPQTPFSDVTKGQPVQSKSSAGKPLDPRQYLAKNKTIDQGYFDQGGTQAGALSSDPYGFAQKLGIDASDPRIKSLNLQRQEEDRRYWQDKDENGRRMFAAQQSGIPFQQVASAPSAVEKALSDQTASQQRVSEQGQTNLGAAQVQSALTQATDKNGVTDPKRVMEILSALQKSPAEFETETTDAATGNKTKQLFKGDIAKDAYNKAQNKSVFKPEELSSFQAFASTLKDKSATDRRKFITQYLKNNKIDLKALDSPEVKQHL